MELTCVWCPKAKCPCSSKSCPYNPENMNGEIQSSIKVKKMNRKPEPAKRKMMIPYGEIEVEVYLYPLFPKNRSLAKVRK